MKNFKPTEHRLIVKSHLIIARQHLLTAIKNIDISLGILDMDTSLVEECAPNHTYGQDLLENMDQGSKQSQQAVSNFLRAKNATYGM